MIVSFTMANQSQIDHEYGGGAKRKHDDVGEVNETLGDDDCVSRRDGEHISKKGRRACNECRQQKVCMLYSFHIS